MTRIAPAVLALLVLGMFAPSLAVEAKDKKDGTVINGDLGSKLDAAVVQSGGAEFWGSVLVSRDGKILLAKGYGFADYGKKPNTPKTLFELASASKQVTAAAVLHLQRKKKLTVTDTLDRFFKKVPEDKKGIQVHHLLTHTSGISGNVGVPYASPISRKEYVKEMLSKPLIAEPGEKYEYSNAGYALLAAIVEEVSRKSFEEYVEKYLFKPAKLKNTGFINDRDLIRTGRASVRRTDEPGSWTAANWHWGWGYRGMGGVVTTVLDMHLWDRALRGDKVLDDKAKRALYTPFKDNYAYGWMVEKTKRGTRKALHTGSVAGYGTNIIRYLEEDVAVIVLSNEGKAAWEVAAVLEKLLFPAGKGK